MALKNKYKVRKSRTAKGFLRRFLGLVVWLFTGCVFFALISLILIFGYQELTQSNYFALNKILVQGNYRLSKQNILSLARLKTGSNLFALSMAEIESRIVKDPWIQGAVIERRFPDQIKIVVQEIQPFYWIKQKNKIFYANRFGEAVAPVRGEKFVSLPFLSFDKESSRQVKILSRLQEYLQARELPFSAAEIGWIQFLSSEIVEFYLRDREIVLRVGTETIAENFKCLQKVWRDMTDRKELKEVKRVVVYRQKGWIKLEADVS